MSNEPVNSNPESLEYITVAEAASIIKVSSFTIKRYIKSNKLIAKRTPGGHWRLLKSSCYDCLTGGGSE